MTRPGAGTKSGNRVDDGRLTRPWLREAAIMFMKAIGAKNTLALRECACGEYFHVDMGAMYEEVTCGACGRVHKITRRFE